MIGAELLQSEKSVGSILRVTLICARAPKLGAIYAAFQNQNEGTESVMEQVGHEQCPYGLLAFQAEV